MAKNLLRSLLLILSGCALTYGILQFSHNDPEPAFEHNLPPIATFQQTAKISTQEAEQHRRSGFEAINNLADVSTLPTAFTQDQALTALAGRTGQQTIEQLISEAKQLPNSNLKRSALATLFARYAELNPERAAQQITHITGSYQRETTFAVFHYWARMDINRTIDAVLQQPNKQLRQWAAEAIYYAWHHDDKELLTDIELRLADAANIGQLKMTLQMQQLSGSPQEMMSQALASEDSASKWQHIEQAAEQWASENPREAYQFVQNLTDQQESNWALQAVLRTWAETESGAIEALDVLASNPDRATQAMNISTVIGSLANHNPEKALEMTNTLPAATQRNAYRAVFRNWASKDVRAAMAALEQLPNANFRREVGSSVIYNFATQHPLEALQWATENNTTGNNQQDISTVLSQVARTHPDEAIATLQTLSSNGQNQFLAAMVLPTIANDNPAKAAELIQQLPAGQGQQMAITQIARQWMEQDPEAALDWIATQSEQTQVMAMRQAGNQLAYQNPDKAIELMERLPASVRSSWVPTIAAAKAQNNPQEAAEWIQEFRGERNYPQMLQQVSATWAQQDPQAALEFALSQPAEQGNIAVQTTVTSWAVQDPQSAANWISANSQQPLANSARNVATTWARQNPQAAQQWAQSLRSPETRDNAISGVISSGALTTNNAMELIGAIDDKRARSTALTGLFSNQYLFNRQAALELRDHPNLTEEDRQTIDQLQKAMDENQGFGVFPGARF